MIHARASGNWEGSILQRLFEAGGISLEDLNGEIARGETLERLQGRLPDVMSPEQRDYLAALRRDRIQLVARGKL